MGTMKDQKELLADLLSVRARLLNVPFLDESFTALPHVKACAGSVLAFNVVTLTGHPDRSHPDRWHVVFAAEDLPIPWHAAFADAERYEPLPDGRGYYETFGNTAAMNRDLALLIDSDFAHAPHAQAFEISRLDLSAVRERLHCMHRSPDTWPFGCYVFTAAPHVELVEFGDNVGLEAHTRGHPDWWQLAFRTDGVPWFHTGDWKVSGNVKVMEVDIVALVISSFDYKPRYKNNS